MCCGAAFWKRFLVFSLTFVIGVAVANLFVSTKACTSEIEPATEIKRPLPRLAPPQPQTDPAADRKNCVPVDGKLKYERLAALEKSNKEAKKEAPQTSPKSEKENAPDAAAPFYNAPQRRAEVKDLLHRERCFESDGRK